MGVGHVFIVDLDRIETANLSRSILYRAEDNGKPKVEVAARRYKEIFPEGKTRALDGDLNYDLGLGVFRRMDAIIGCLDNQRARKSLNQFCYRVNKPWVDGGIDELLGQVRVFYPGQGACFECTLGKADYERMKLEEPFNVCRWRALKNISIGRTPTTPTAASIIAAFQVQEALKLLHPERIQMDPATESKNTFRLLAGKVLKIDGHLNEEDAIFISSYKKREDCLAHEIYAPIVDLENCTAAGTTAGRLLEIAEDIFGERPVAIHLGHEIVAYQYCRNSSHEEIRRECFLPFFKITGEETPCPACGQPMQDELTHWITADSPFLEQPLAKLGVPPLQILKAQSERQVLHLELTGDLNEVLNFT
jgi:adenylyltransferase/sulfurtransferase